MGAVGSIEDAATVADAVGVEVMSSFSGQRRAAIVGRSAS
jgi:hypothetical protein